MSKLHGIERPLSKPENKIVRRMLRGYYEGAWEQGDAMLWELLSCTGHFWPAFWRCAVASLK